MSTSFDATAAAYDQRVGRWSRLYIPTLVAAAGIRPGDRVVDVATGTGEAAIVAAAAAGPGGRVLGCDVSLPMLRIARAKTENLPVLLAVMDAQTLGCREESADAVLCQLGLMFLPDVGRGLREFRRVLRKGRRMAACVWSAADRAPLVSIFAGVLAGHVPEKREEIGRGTSLGDGPRLHRLFESAGFGDVSVRAETRPTPFASFEEYWEPIAGGGSPGAVLYNRLPQAARDIVKAEVRARMRPYQSGEQLILETEALIVAGRK